jgi:hypothetical protein
LEIRKQRIQEYVKKRKHLQHFTNFRTCSYRQQPRDVTAENDRANYCRLTHTSGFGGWTVGSMHIISEISTLEPNWLP